MSKIQASAIEVLRQVMQARNWHQNKYPQNKASGYKDLLNKGKLSHEKCSEILNTIGWQKIKEETWESPNA